MPRPSERGEKAPSGRPPCWCDHLAHDNIMAKRENACRKAALLAGCRAHALVRPSVNYERQNIRALAGYAWGEQPRQLNLCKLNTNENPYPPSPEVEAALRAFSAAELRTYPQPTADSLRGKLAELHGLDLDNVLITHGGDEALRLAVTTFVEPSTPLGCAAPSYSLYPVLAGIQDAPLLQAAYTEDWKPPINLAQLANDAGTRLTCIANPHAPSGQLLGVDECAQLAADLDGVLLLDEAYADFVYPRLAYHTPPLLNAFDNLLILRSFSKGYSLSGLRLGYLLGHPTLIAPMLTKTRDSYNVDAISQTLGLAAVQDQAYARETWRKVQAERARLRTDLANRGLHCPASEANFLLATVPSGAKLGAKELYQALKEQGILVRYFDAPRLVDKLRITVGTPAQNQRLINALDLLIADVSA